MDEVIKETALESAGFQAATPPSAHTAYPYPVRPESQQVVASGSSQEQAPEPIIIRVRGGGRGGSVVVPGSSGKEKLNVLY